MLQTILRQPKTAQDIALGSRLGQMQNRIIGPEAVATVLAKAKAVYVLVEAHATNGYTGRPRATVDVDVVARHPKKAAAAIQSAFPHLTIKDTPVVIRFSDEDHEAIDVMKPVGSLLWRELLKDRVAVRIGNTKIFVPTVEGVLASKFAAMVSIHRRYADKMIDAGDFLRIVEVNPKLNETKLLHLGDLIYSGGGAEMLKLLADARAGRRLEF
jgi:hypothetical protein